MQIERKNPFFVAPDISSGSNREYNTNVEPSTAQGKPHSTIPI